MNHVQFKHAPEEVPISSAKQPEPRRNRIAKAYSMLAAEKRRPWCFGGLNWLVNDHPATGGT